MKVVLLLKYLSAIQHCTDIISFGYCSNEGYQTSFMSGTFLAEDSSYYFSMLEILLGKLSKHLFDQVSHPYLNVSTLPCPVNMNFQSCTRFLHLQLTVPEENCQVC